jgi:hypothetical protein
MTNTPSKDSALTRRFGPAALITGASEEIGRAFAARVGMPMGQVAMPEMVARRGFAKSTIVLFTTEVIAFLGLWKSMCRIAWKTLQSVIRANTERRHKAIGHPSPPSLREQF